MASFEDYGDFTSTTSDCGIPAGTTSYVIYSILPDIHNPSYHPFEQSTKKEMQRIWSREACAKLYRLGFKQSIPETPALQVVRIFRNTALSSKQRQLDKRRMWVQNL